MRAVRGVVADPSAVFILSMLAGTLLSVAIASVMFVVVEHPFLMLRDRVIFPKAVSHA